MTQGTLIGYEINERACQISFYNDMESEPNTIEADSEHDYIPLCIGKLRDTWVYGKDALRLTKVKEGFTATRLLERGLAGEILEHGKESYDAVWLLSKFVQLTLKDFNTDIEGIVFSVPTLSEDLANLLRTVATNMNIPKNRIFVQDYKESFCNYLFYQPKELWQYEAVLFSCDRTDIKAYTMRRLRAGLGDGKTTFVVVDEIANDQFRDVPFVYPVLDEIRAKEADRQLSKFVERVFYGRTVSSVYLTGGGFEGNWFPSSLRLICSGRRAFMGNNLYSKGACYTAYRKTFLHSEDPTYLSDDKITEQISISMRVDGQEMWYPIVSWGSYWYEASGQWNVLLKDVKDIELHIESLAGGDVRTETISLENFPKRVEYSMRIQIETMFLNRKTCKITVRDMGFGEFFSQSDFVEEKIIELGGSNGKLYSLS